MNVNERIDALMEKHGVEENLAKVPVKIGNKNNVVVGGNGWLGQRFPVTLYGPSWLWLLREENTEAILDFLEQNETNITWSKN